MLFTNYYYYIYKRKLHYLFYHKFSFKVLILLYYLIQQIIFDLQQIIIYILNAYKNNLSTQVTKKKYMNRNINVMN